MVTREYTTKISPRFLNLIPHKTSIQGSITKQIIKQSKRILYMSFVVILTLLVTLHTKASDCFWVSLIEVYVSYEYFSLKVKLLKTLHWLYFKSKWNLFELAVIVLSWSAVAVFIKRTLVGNRDITHYRNHRDQWDQLLSFWGFNSADSKKSLAPSCFLINIPVSLYVDLPVFTKAPWLTQRSSIWLPSSCCCLP